MNIAFFVSRFPTISETFIVNQIIGLQKAGHTVHIYSKEKGNDSKIHDSVMAAALINHTTYISDIPRTRFGRMCSLAILFLNNFSLRNLKLLFNAAFRNKSALSVYELINYLGKTEYNIVHAHFGPNGNYVVKLKKMGLFQKAGFITTFHGFDLAKEYGNGFYKDLFDFCHHFTVNTKYSKGLLEALGCPPDRITVLPVGLDVTEFTNTKSNKSNYEIQLLFVGRLIPLKGPDLFIEMCRILKEKNIFEFKGVLIGEGELFQELKELVTSAGLDEVVSLLGAKTQMEVTEYMINSDIFILPGTKANGLSEAQGLVIQEAQAMELPVLISNSGGMSEGIIDGVTGFVISQTDLQGFVDKIELLSNNPMLRKKMGKAGRRLVEEKYDTSVLNIRLLKLYSKANTA